MTRLRHIAFIAALLTIATLPHATHAQEYSYGIDPGRDSAAFARFRLRMDSVRSHRPTVALVLSGGGAKGAAHVSVIHYLDSIGMPIDLVVGTSIGGLVGGLYACGYNANQLADIFLNQDWDYLLRDLHSTRYDALAQKDLDRQHQLTIPFGKLDAEFFHRPNQSKRTSRNLIAEGITQGQNVTNLLNALTVGHTDPCDFLKLPTPFVCVASDMVSARPKIWHSGSLVQALRSTMSIPGLFTPVKVHDMVLLDGAMRSNFPVEVARQLGIDYVIGVDISAPPLTADQINTFMDIVYQTTDVLGRDTYAAAVAATDIYIKPRLNDYSLLSFSKQNITDIMRLGHQAVAQHDTQLAALRNRLAASSQQSTTNAQTTIPVNLTTDTVAIAAVNFFGVSAKGEQYLKHLLHIGPRVTRTDLEEAVAVMMGTKVFESVTYELLGPRSPYILRFNCKPNPLNIISGGIRFDTKDMGAVLLTLGLNTRRLVGSQWTFSGRLGLKSSLQVNYDYRTRKGVNIVASAAIQSVTNGEFLLDASDYQINYTQANAELGIDVTHWRRFSISAGACLDYFHRNSVLVDYNLHNQVDDLNPENAYAGLFLRLRSDSFNDAYYPTEGFRSMLDAKLFAPGLIYRRDLIYSLHADLEYVLSVGPVAFRPFAQARYVDATLLPYLNVLSVYNTTRLISHQIPFIGINATTVGDRLMATAGASVRVNFFGRNYISVIGQLLQQSDALYSIFLPEKSHGDLGLGLEYSYRSPMGPLSANIHWSTLNRQFGFLISLGLDF